MKPATSTTTTSWRGARFVEGRVLPIVTAFVLGIVVTSVWQDDEVQRERLALRELTQIALACAPLLSLPAGSTPELIPIDTPEVRP